MNIPATTVAVGSGAVKSGATDHVAAQFAAIMTGDMAAFARSFAPGATVWHNFDGVAEDIATASIALAALHRNSSRVEYLEQRIVAIDNVRFIQHILTADLHNGATLHLPAMMRMELADDGRVARVEEYFDSRAIDCLRMPHGAVPSG